MISLKDKQFDPVCQKKFILFPNILYGGSCKSLCCNRLDPREFIIEDLIELSLPKSVVFRKYIPQRIMDGSLVNFEFYMSNELTDPGIEEAQIVNITGTCQRQIHLYWSPGLQIYIGYLQK